MTKICFISDTHNRHRELDIPKCDLLIHCGDFSNTGKQSELIDFNGWIGDLKSDKVIEKAIVVYGNHELMAEKNRQKADSLLSAVDHKLVHGCTEEFGLKIWGCSYVPSFYDWAFMRSENELYFIYNQIPVNFDIVVCHGPPKGICDRYEGRGGDPHRGSAALREVIEIKAPRVMAFGHIHESRGIERFKDTLFINCANYASDGTLKPPIILDI